MSKAISKRYSINQNINNKRFFKKMSFVFFQFLFICSFNIALAKEITNQTEMTVLGVPIITKQKTFIGTGKASVELEDNDSSRLELDQQEEFFRSEADTDRVVDEKRQKKKKFKSFYKKPEQCLPPKNNDIRISCVNEYIRKKAEFEELYRLGKI
jgi:hypothetical protein